VDRIVDRANLRRQKIARTLGERPAIAARLADVCGMTNTAGHSLALDSGSPPMKSGTVGLLEMPGFLRERRARHS